MFDGLQRMAPWLFLPGVEIVEADGVALLETTPRVIEAYMAGLNHELSRELLWREFPAALTGTAFRQFWDVSGQPGDAESLADIPPLAEWAGTPLGGHVRARASRDSGSTTSPGPVSRARRTRWPGRTCRSRRPATRT
jgi:hypothetical protein